MRRYSDQEVAEGLAALEGCGGSIKRAARLVKVPPNTLRRWAEAERQGRRGVTAAVKQQARASLVERFGGLSRSLLDRLEGGMDGLSPYQAGILSAVMADKAVALRQASPRGSEGGAADELAQLTATSEGRESLAELSVAFARVMRAANRRVRALPVAVEVGPEEVQEV